MDFETLCYCWLGDWDNVDFETGLLLTWRLWDTVVSETVGYCGLGYCGIFVPV